MYKILLRAAVSSETFSYICEIIRHKTKNEAREKGKEDEDL